MIKDLKELRSELKDKPLVFVKEAIKLAAGFILSPLSWWNDLFINVPLAWAFAYVSARIINIFASVNMLFFTILFLIGYMITNVAGILMMGSSVRVVTKKKSKALNAGIAAGVVYSIVVVAVGYSEFADSLSIIPDWVIR